MCRWPLKEWFRAGGADVEIDDGVVTLKGEVSSEDDVKKVEKAAKGADGAKGVKTPDLKAR